MIRHHPPDDWLLRLAAGRLDGGSSLLLDTHLEGCAQCRTRLREFEAFGGALLDDVEPELLMPEALAHTLERIDGPDPAAPRRPAREPRFRARLPNGLPWPAALRDCATGPWRWIGPGTRFSRVTLPQASPSTVFLLRLADGHGLRIHTHSDVEMTQVLYGQYRDGRSVFASGDFDAADNEVRHRPRVFGGDECICLISVQGKVLFEDRITRWVASLIGI